MWRLAVIKLTRKLTLFLVGIFFMGMGVAIITEVELGTSPISTIPYVMSYITIGSFGFWTFALSLVFITAQIIILRDVRNHTFYLQLFISPLLGISIDSGMWLTQMYTAESLVVRLLCLIIGCFVLALGIFFQVKAQLVMNPGEGIVYIIAQKLRKPFSTVKIGFDWTLVVIATVLGQLFLKTPLGIGIGTLISAFLVGYFVRLLSQVKAFNLNQST